MDAAHNTIFNNGIGDKTNNTIEAKTNVLNRVSFRFAAYKPQAMEDTQQKNMQKKAKLKAAPLPSRSDTNWTNRKNPQHTSGINGNNTAGIFSDGFI